MTCATMDTSMRKGSPVVEALTGDLQNLTGVTGSAVGVLGEFRVLCIPVM